MTQGFEALGLISPGALSELWDVGDTKLDEFVKDELLTTPIRLGPRTRRWPPHEIAEIRQAHIEGRSKDEIRELVRKLQAQRSQKQAA
jgi:predicted DNA-binding transcriptional regulator AlpA